MTDFCERTGPGYLPPIPILFPHTRGGEISPFLKRVEFPDRDTHAILAVDASHELIAAEPDFVDSGLVKGELKAGEEGGNRKVELRPRETGRNQAFYVSHPFKDQKATLERQILDVSDNMGNSLGKTLTSCRDSFSAPLKMAPSTYPIACVFPGLCISPG